MLLFPFLFWFFLDGAYMWLCNMFWNNPQLVSSPLIINVNHNKILNTPMCVAENSGTELPGMGGRGSCLLQRNKQEQNTSQSSQTWIYKLSNEISDSISLPTSTDKSPFDSKYVLPLTQIIQSREFPDNLSILLTRFLKDYTKIFIKLSLQQWMFVQ